MREEGAEKQPRQAFRGYPPPTSSTTYTPNQFFDVVLPNASRGCLRLVAYIMRKTLGWSDSRGNPRNPKTTASYRELEEQAGIGRGRIREAIQEGIEKRFINCLRLGMPNREGEGGYSALYTLRWDRRPEYTTDPDAFDGFFDGSGNLTHIPNDFFDFTVPSEPLSVVQVIGVIIRNTIGWQSGRGLRRQEVALSFSEIMRRTRIASRTTVSQAIKAAIKGNHIYKVKVGVFDPNAGMESCSTTYGLRWIDRPEDGRRGVFPFPAGVGSSSGTGDRFKRCTAQNRTVPKVDRTDGSKTGPAKASKSEPANPPKVDSEEIQNWTAIKTTDLNNKKKQQQKLRTAADDSKNLVFRTLLEEGIDASKAFDLASRFPTERIQRQVAWLSQRKIRASRTGMLIAAIERDLPLPSPAQPQRHPQRQHSLRARTDTPDLQWNEYLAYVGGLVAHLPELALAFEQHSNKRLEAMRSMSERAFRVRRRQLADPDQRSLLLAEFALDRLCDPSLNLESVPTFRDWVATSKGGTAQWQRES